MNIFGKGDSFSIDNLEEGGAFLVDKDLDWTSFDVVNKLRFGIKRVLNKKKVKVGHAGTLDPRATGLLLVCCSKATKQINTLQDLGKEYTGTFYIGGTTPTYDTESEIDQNYPTDHINDIDIHNATKDFFGDLSQIPPIFSAVKRNGVPMYKRARAGEDIKMAPRLITIQEFEITSIKMPEIEFRVVCSKGTYIRSLAYDFGKALGSGGYLQSLRRTKIGDYNVKNALSVIELSDKIGTLHV
ncbi:MAG: tRNA pseudouridine(55) synthase TruB [Saprospiraceae bacterium]|nr:tRNA pseudouridine(55) synthase TruB [Saprospiraceae bacterium]|tara:strand:+ start:6798 stop:7523 length:726 start_codon:yes stop_codon:yes gene_type:complete